MNKQILRLAIPNIITNITVPLLGMADTAIAGRLPDAMYIGAVSVSAVIFNFIYWNFGFLRMGTAGFTAQACGAKNKKETVNILLRSLSLAFGAGLTIIVLQSLLFKAALLFIKTGPVVQGYVSDYFFIYIWAAPFALGLYTMTGWFIGMQDAKTPMFVAIFTNIANIVLSLAFVILFGMQLKGLALGSLLAQVSGFLLAAGIWSVKYGYLSQYLSFNFLRNLQDFKPFFSVNRDIFLRSAGIISVTVFFTAASARMGGDILNANTLLMQFFIFFSYLMDGFAYAAEALCGKYFGAGENSRLILLIRRLFLWGFAVAAAFSLIYLLFAGGLLRLLTDKTAVIATAKTYVFWAAAFPLAGFAAFLWDGIFVGLTAARQMRNSVFAGVALFFALYLLLTPRFGNHGLLIAFNAWLIMRGLMETLLFKSVNDNKTIKS